MRKWLVVLSVALMCGKTAATGIPVFDGAAATNFMQQWLQMLKDYAMMVQQYNQAVTTYESMTGSRGFGMLHHAQNLIRLMPEDLQRSFDQTLAMGYEGLSTKGKAAFEEMGLDLKCSGLNGMSLEGCRNEQAVQAEYLAALREIDSISSQVLNETQNLMREINRTDDMKGASELQAQIQAKLASFSMARAQASAQLSQMQSMKKEAAQREAERLHRASFQALSDAEIDELCR